MSSAHRPRSTTRGCAPSSPVAWPADCPAGAEGRDSDRLPLSVASTARAESGRALSATPGRSLASTSARSRSAPVRTVDLARRRRGRGQTAGCRSAPKRRAGRERASRSIPAAPCARRRSAAAPAPAPPPRRRSRRTDGQSSCHRRSTRASRRAAARCRELCAPVRRTPTVRAIPRAPAGSRRDPGSASSRRVRSTRRGSGSIRRRQTRSRTAPFPPPPPRPNRQTIRPACGSHPRDCESSHWPR